MPTIEELMGIAIRAEREAREGLEAAERTIDPAEAAALRREAEEAWTRGRALQDQVLAALRDGGMPG